MISYRRDKIDLKIRIYCTNFSQIWKGGYTIIMLEIDDENKIK